MPATIDVIKADPLKFLKVFPIYLSGTKKSITREVFYGKKGNFLRFEISFPNVDPGVTAEKVKAHVVAAAHGVPAYYAMGAGADVMITSQLSGCCLVYKNNQLAHVWPHAGDSCQCGAKGLPGESGLEVQTRLERSELGGRIYGKKNYQDKTAYVIGFNNGGWKFYAQEQSGGAITRAVQIFN